MGHGTRLTFLRQEDNRAVSLSATLQVTLMNNKGRKTESGKGHVCCMRVCLGYHTV